ncbi:hypothetical protein K3495_g10904 [Podosphaera aphanis]|nr:hypothetical protein K3495_g10904 [Podosphaera aphanis]
MKPATKIKPVMIRLNWCGTADGNPAFYKRYTSIYIGVDGIWRVIDSLVWPHNVNGHNQAMMLGLPWFHTVNAIIDLKIRR